MRSFLLRSFVLTVLCSALVVPVVAQKGKIKDKRKSSRNDSTKVRKGGKAALKERMAKQDSLTRSDSVPAVVEMPTAVRDSNPIAESDSTKPQPRKRKKRFYTRVTESQLVRAEGRAAMLRERISQAELDLEAYREESEEGTKDSFSKEELDGFEASIVLARDQLVKADSSLSMIRNRLKEEGRLGKEGDKGAEAAAIEADLDEDDEDGEATLPDPGSGKGKLKNRSGSGKGSIKGKSRIPPESEREADIDD